MTADKLDDIFKNSFKNEAKTCYKKYASYVATNNFMKEYCKGASYCNVDNKLKKYSFLFVTTSTFINKKVDKEGDFDSEAIRRRSINFRNSTDGSGQHDFVSVSITTPEYLIICEV